MKIVKKDANDQNVSNIKQMHAMCIHSFGAWCTTLTISHSILVLVGLRVLVVLEWETELKSDFRESSSTCL